MAMSSRPADYKPTIAVDFDGVLYPYRPPFTHELTEEPIEGAVEWFNSLYPEFRRVIFSCRALETQGQLAIWSWMSRHGFICWGLKVTPVKPHADLYVDDRAYRFEGPGTYPSLEFIHSFKPWLSREA